MNSLQRPVVVVLALLACAAPARGQDSARVGSYDFGYLLAGDTRARPVQVFDDGRDTYLQFRAGEPLPAIFALRAGLPHLLAALPEGPYLRVPQLHGRLLLQLGRAQATALHARGERPEAPPLQVLGAGGAPQPYTGADLPAGARLRAALPPRPRPPEPEAAPERHSYAAPARGDRVAWIEQGEVVEHAIAFARGGLALSREAQQLVARIAQRAGPEARYTAVGRDDDSDREGLERARAEALRAALLKAGVAPERIQLRTGPMKPAARSGFWESTMRVEVAEAAPAARSINQAAQAGNRTGAPPAPAPQPPPAPEVPAGGFTLGPADQTISGAVRRWAHALGYQLVWDAPAALDAPITGEANLQAHGLAAALERLLQGLREQGYALEVTLYANRVIRFAPAPAPTRSEPVPQRPLLQARPGPF